MCQDVEGFHVGRHPSYGTLKYYASAINTEMVMKEFSSVREKMCVYPYLIEKDKLKNCLLGTAFSLNYSRDISLIIVSY